MLDARGYSCPTPVVMVQKEMKEKAPQVLEVLVDNRCSVENVSRFASHQGYTANVEPQGTDFLLTLRRAL